MAWKKLFKKSKQTILVYEPYLKTTKLGSWFTALNTQKYSELEV